MDEIKEKLMKMQTEIMDDLDAEHNLTLSSVTNDIGDSIDHASEERERELHQILCDRDRAKLIQLKEALIRIKNKTFGNCESCEDKISKKRLLAMPFTRLCVTCKADEEKTSGQLPYEEESSTLDLESGEYDV